ncbi:hypothetical protein FRX31_032300 [Thalictrum thalictroides]|uniref:F-box domain-containing protein n=1 Tax=Thalictrum thalictroides TaxID=46969 RepID=A0A7J6UZK9_THATH|nr:hypothetical protein FRX31_032300 [Thalictrum thalictroides]
MDRMEELEMGGSCEELVEEILYHIPIKPLIRMKCLAKGWCSFSSCYRLSITRTSPMVCQYRISAIPESQIIIHRARWRNRKQL